MSLQMFLQTNCYSMAPIIYSFLTYYEMGQLSQTDSETYLFFYQEILPTLYSFHCKRVMTSSLFHFVSQLTNIRQLEIHHIRSYQMDQCLKSLQSLKCVEEFTYCNSFMDPYTMVEFTKLLYQWSSRLRVLNVSQNGISHQIIHLSNLLPQLKRLECLDVSNNGIDKKGARSLIQSLLGLTRFKSLNMIGNYVGSEGGMIWGELVVNLPQLETLKISSNQLGPDGFQSFTSMLSSNLSSQLMTLDLSWNSLYSQNIIFEFNSLSSLKHLICLNLSWNYLNDQAAYSLSLLLPSLTKLQTLHLSTCHLSTIGIQKIADCFPFLKDLRYLDLSCNGITKDILWKLIPAFSSLNNLQTLDLSWNHFHREGDFLLSYLTSTLLSFHTLYTSVEKKIQKGIHIL